MIECPNYGDVCLVPMGWYTNIESRQVVYQAREYGYQGDLSPVVLRGARHCRIHKHASHRDYGYSVLMRYIRMRRLTFIDRKEWEQFCLEKLLPMAQRQPWWHRQRSLWTMFFYMVRDWQVFIEGEPVLVTDKQMMANMKKIHSAIRRLKVA